jgi:ABC-type sulfate transport system substrate-binding protein
MLQRKLKQGKLLIALKEKVNNILMKLETSAFQSHLPKEKSATAMHVAILYKVIQNTQFDKYLSYECNYKET